MKKVKGEWHITSVNDLLGWEIEESDMHSINERTGVAFITIRNKTSGEIRPVHCPVYLLPIASLEYKRDDR